MVDINLMPPMILKNCLPFNLTIIFIDSSNVKQSITLAKDEEKYLFCFNMANYIERNPGQARERWHVLQGACVPEIDYKNGTKFLPML